eukprot:TRINITY_DN21293_c0_g1_i1.p3 TRINITY_DN21293_c0_g1~~TRINITY_DN21293_c0_g1_i1.p3  ORF type:complete len:106 (-),score=4.10 TRINITY_DN21293_c0_g1_i1:306-623(-)
MSNFQFFHSTQLNLKPSCTGSMPTVIMGFDERLPSPSLERWYTRKLNSIVSRMNSSCLDEVQQKLSMENREEIFYYGTSLCQSRTNALHSIAKFQNTADRSILAN